MKHLIIIFFLFSSTLATAFDGAAEIESLERARKANHERAYKQLADINYFRMKAITAEKTLKSVADGSAAVKNVCGVGSFVACRDQVDSLLSQVDGEVFKIRQLQVSSKYKQMLSGKAIHDVGLIGLLDGYRSQLANVWTQLQALREKAGARAAEQEFADAQARLKAQSQSFSDLSVCKLSYPRAKVLYVSAMQDLTQSEVQSNPFLIQRSQRKTREVTDILNVLDRKCPRSDSEGLRKRLLSLDQQGWQKRIFIQFDRACRQLAPDKRVAEICHEKIVNDSSLFFLHLVLKKSGAAK